MNQPKLFISAFGVLSVLLLMAFKPAEHKKVIVIDAAHGGADAGAKVAGVTEKNIVAQIAHKIQALNKDNKVELVLLRNADETISLQERVNKANHTNPDLLISLHVDMNLKAPTQKGVMALVSHKNVEFQKSLAIAKMMLQQFGNNSVSTKDAGPFVLQNVSCSAMVLELGNIANEQERNYLISQQGQEEIAKKIFNSIQ